MLDALTLGTWIASVGLLLLRERPVIARLLVPFGAATMAASLMSMVGFHSIALIAADLAVVLLIWIGWVAFDRQSRHASSQ